ncbi:MAG TPA: TatD family hydrolase [Cyclobacteriaceae bacterium]|nr:TatD family hydrolase [Cyclobacteriaceae bacterium]
MYLIDTHAHIYLPEFTADLDEVIVRSRKEGVQLILMPNIAMNTIAPMLEVSGRYPDFCLPMIGLHPCSVDKNFRTELEILERKIKETRYYGIGETGIDLYWDKTYLYEQIESLEFQAEMAILHQLPLILHCRDSINETIGVIKSFSGKSLTGIFHCFTGTARQAAEITELGFMLGIGGVITFKNSNLAQALNATDLHHLVLETDSPYLAPVPFRGKRNDPSRLVHIAGKLAEAMHTTQEEIAELTSRNAIKLFGLRI